MTQTQLAPIRQLPPNVVNKIAAGEVIERPASVVKELLENSVDAGASRIELSIENGGADLIRISDDGCGIPGDQLLLAVTSHATSKIADAEDLFRVGTLGFRGEALASIAEVSQMLIRSRPSDQQSGFEIAINGGKHDKPAPCGCPAGTTIEVRQLFFNTPVRRKFLRSGQTEKGHIGEAFTRVALSHPNIHMTMLHNGKTVHELPPAEQWQDRIAAFFGDEIGQALIPISNSDGEVLLAGFVVDPSISRANNRMQYLFLNNRYIRDRSLQHALSEGYRGLLMTGRFPIAFLRMSMPFELVDVNVHPAKLEVRFQEGGKLYSQLLATLRNKFLSSDLTARARLNPPPPTPVGHQMLTEPAQGTAFQLQQPDLSQQERLDFKSQPARIDWAQPRSRQQDPPSSPSSATPETTGDSTGASITDSSGNDVAPAPIQRSRPLALQVHNTYLISETEEGMVVIDQHALHERIIYEQLREKVLGGTMETQQLLVPEPVALPPAEAAAVLDRRDVLAKIGMEVESFGGDTVLVTAYPAMLANHNPAEMLRSVVDHVMADDRTPEERDLVDQLLHMISCKAAVKAGDQLSIEEIEALLEHRQLCQDSHHCPHGRPTSLVFSREELDRRFKRI